MNNLLAQLHFLRPVWLLLLLPAIALLVLLLRRASSAANWRRAIAPELIDYLLEPGQQQRRHWLWPLAIAWLLATLAMAGPSWEKIPQPVLQKRDGVVIVLDLSLSMYAEDIQPSRLQRARYKVLDLLQRRREGLTGLVVYSGDAHVVSPLTDDTATIANLVPALAPAMMPSYGSNAAAGIDSAIALLQNSGFERGRIVLISDEIDDAGAAEIAGKFKSHQWQLSMLGVGTAQGAPIPTQDGFLKSASGTIAIAQLHRERFTALAQQTGALYSDLSLDDHDLDTLLPDSAIDANTTRTVQREFDQWRERGPQLVMLLLPLAAFAFRRGWLLALLLLPLSAPSQALEWQDLWQRPDQQAQRLFAEGNSKEAAQKFTDPAWRGAAQYRSGDYENAAQTLANLPGADAQYNRGNALAQAGKLPEAIAAYDAALKQNPTMEDAKFNRELVRKLLQQQKNKSQQQNKNDQQQKNSNSEQQQKSDSGSDDNNDGKKGEKAENGGQQKPQNKPADQGAGKSDPNQLESKQTANAGADANTQQEAQPRNSAEKSAQAAAQNQSAQSGSNADEKNPTKAPQQPAKSSEQQLQQRATEQWLRQIPDDPAGLLRRKFLYEYRQRQRETTTRGDQPAW
jgi:Ca-activated chloride channel family protein